MACFVQHHISQWFSFFAIWFIDRTACSDRHAFPRKNRCLSTCLKRVFSFSAKELALLLFRFRLLLLLQLRCRRCCCSCHMPWPKVSHYWKCDSYGECQNTLLLVLVLVVILVLVRDQDRALILILVPPAASKSPNLQSWLGCLLMPQGQPATRTLLNFAIICGFACSACSTSPSAGNMATPPPLFRNEKKEKTATRRVLCRATKKKEWHKNRVHASKIQRSAYENEPARGKATGHDERNARKKVRKSAQEGQWSGRRRLLQQLV